MRHCKNPLDVPGLLRWIRRELDLSQRDLAQMIGVSHSTIGRLETGAQRMSLDLFEIVLDLMGWSLRDALAGEAQPAMSSMTVEDEVRDNGGRLYPAHLDVHLPCETPHWWHLAPRYGRKRPRADFEMRERRNLRRERECYVPVVHPTEAERAEWLDLLREAREIRNRVLTRRIRPREGWLPAAV